MGIGYENVTARRGLGRGTFAAFDLAHTAPFNLVYANEIESHLESQFE